MKRNGPAVETADCDRCPAFKVADGAIVDVGNLVAIPGRLAAQETDGVWHAVVSTQGKGTFLVRRREGWAAAACPLRAYEIRFIAPDQPLDRKPAGGFGEPPGPGSDMPRPARAGLYTADGLQNKRGVKTQERK